MWWKLFVLGALLELVAAQAIVRDKEFTHLTNLTFGKSGVGCTPQGRKCIKEATCVNQRCQCPAKGHGEIECVDRDKILCVLAADPHIVSFHDATAFVSLPCRFRAARFITPYTPEESATCTFEVFGTNQLLHGRYVIRHVHIAVSITHPNGQFMSHADIFKNSTLNFDVDDTAIYAHAARVRHSDKVWGSTEDDENFVGFSFVPGFDGENNFAVLDIPDCGTRIKYRAYDPRRNKHQKQLPGMTIMAPQTATFGAPQAQFPSSLCGTKSDNRNLYKDHAARLNLKDESTALLYAVLQEKIVQEDNYGMMGRCNRAFDTFKQSTNQAADTNFCGFLLTQPNVGKCIEESQREPIDIFSACLAQRQGDNRHCGALNYIVEKCKGAKGWDSALTADSSCPGNAPDLMSDQ